MMDKENMWNTLKNRLTIEKYVFKVSVTLESLITPCNVRKIVYIERKDKNLEAH